MPMKPGKSKKVISENIREMHHGPSYKKVAKRHGAKVAHKMAIAAAFSNARKTGSKRKK